MPEITGETERPGGSGFLKWAVLTLVGAVITGGVSTYFSHSNDTYRFEQEKQLRQSEAQEQLLVEQEKLRATHKDFVLKRVAEHDAEDRKLIDTLQGQYFSVVLNNTCDANFYAAVRYAALDGEITVIGWYTLTPKQPVTVLYTKQSWFGFYARDPDGGSLPGDRQVIIEPVNRFEYLDDRYFQDGWLPLAHPKEVPFKTVSIAQKSYGQFTYDLPCTLKYLFKKRPSQAPPFQGLFGSQKPQQ